MLRIAYIDGVGFDVINNRGLEVDKGLETAVLVSLFTDAPATPSELEFFGLTPEQNRGWLGNDYPVVDGDVWGSKLWLLARAKRTDETLARAHGYTTDAVRWMIDDGLAVKIPLTTQWYGRTGFLAVGAQMFRPGDLRPRWRRVWDATTGKLLEAA
jgi:phage gp46-like protein